MKILFRYSKLDRFPSLFYEFFVAEQLIEEWLPKYSRLTHLSQRWLFTRSLLNLLKYMQCTQFFFIREAWHWHWERSNLEDFMSVLLKTSRKGEDWRAGWLRSSMRWMVAGPTFSGALESITNITFQRREREASSNGLGENCYKGSNYPYDKYNGLGG